MGKDKQTRMFGEETFPLFSGTAPQGRVETFSPPPYVEQSCFAKCRFCMDTGRLRDGGYCWCEIGQQLQARKPVG